MTGTVSESNWAEGGRIPLMPILLGGLIGVLGLLPSLPVLYVETSKAFYASLVIFACAAVFSRRALRGGMSGTMTPGIAAVGLLWGYLTVVTVIQPLTYLGVYQLVKGGALVALVVVVGLIRWRTLDACWLSRAAMVAATCVVVYGAIGAIAGLDGAWGSFRPPVKLTFGNQNMFGGYLVMLLALVLPTAVDGRHPRWRMCAMAAAAGTVALVYMTQSRMMIGALIFVAGLFLLLDWRVVRCWPWRKVGMAFAAFVAVTVAVTVVAVVTQPRLTEKVEKVARYPGEGRSTASRELFYLAGADLITSSTDRLLFGHGSGRFRTFFQDVDVRDYGKSHRWRTTHFVHNEYIETWFAGGLVAILVCVAIVGLALQSGVRLMTNGGLDGTDRRVGLGLACGLAGFLLIGFTSVATRYAGMQAIAAVCVAGLLGMARDVRYGGDCRTSKNREPRRRTHRSRSSLLGLGALSLAAGVAALLGWFVAEGISLRREVTALRSGEPQSSTRAYQRLGSVSVFGVPHPDALYLQLRYAGSLDDPVDKASKAWRKLQLQAPHLEKASFAYARILMDAGRHGPAAEVLVGHVKANPFHFEGHLNRSVAAWLAGERNHANRAIVDLIQAHVDFMRLHEGHAVETRTEQTKRGRALVILAARTGDSVPRPIARLWFSGLVDDFMGPRMWSRERLVTHLARRLDTFCDQVSLPAIAYEFEEQ